MKILLLGNGGRENAIGYAIKKSLKCEALFFSPFNVGLDKLGCTYAGDVAKSHIEVLGFCKQNAIDIVIVGPENLLANGIVDDLNKANILAFGPCAAGAQIESSKNFMKDFCIRYNIPTAKYKNFDLNAQNLSHILEFAEEIGYPAVLKTDGLAAGKGVVICNTKAELELNIAEYISGKFGSAGQKIVLEEFMSGKEVSFFAISDGKKAIKFAHASDYKRVYDNDLGPNTGGMGTFSPSIYITLEQEEYVMQRMIDPLVKGMLEDGVEYRGVIFAGLMITGPGRTDVKLIEYNCRFGDPETQSMLIRLDFNKTDLLDVLAASSRGDLGNRQACFTNTTAVNVVMASKGYPENNSPSVEINGVHDIDEDVRVFFAGTKIDKESGMLQTSGGRVLSICATGLSFKEAREAVYSNISKVSFDGQHYRSDIAKFD